MKGGCFKDCTRREKPGFTGQWQIPGKCLFLCLLLCMNLAGYGNMGAKILYGVGLCRPFEREAVSTSGKPPYVIAIDPGHGGIDTGAESLAVETDVTFPTAQYLYEMLRENKNFTPVMTRKEEENPDSGRRAKRANSACRDLFLSVHANSDSSSASRGFECYPAPPGRTFHRESVRFAGLLAKGMEKAGHKIRGKGGIKYAYYDGDKKIIAESSDTRERSLPSFGVLDKTRCPAVLAEQCFLTNRRDVESWTGEAGCRKAARVYYNAIVEFFLGESEKTS